MGLPRQVEMVLYDYINSLDEYFPNTIDGIYLHGSVAINAYEDNSSDIDFLTVTNRRLSEEDSEALSFIHHALSLKYSKPEMDGVYIYWEDLKEMHSQTTYDSRKYQFYNNGVLHFGHYFNFNPVTWWILKNNGIKVIERVCKNIEFEVTTLDLVSYVHSNMNSYWLNYIQHVEENKEIILTSQNIDTEIEWAVLGLLRQYYSIKEQDIISKLAAGTYGLSHLPRRWHTIIQEAINIRKATSVRVINSNRERLESAIQFIRYLIAHCNSLIEKNIILAKEI
jgi:hypothetical protein